jgi:Cu2+-exporting ATPase
MRTNTAGSRAPASAFESVALHVGGQFRAGFTLSPEIAALSMSGSSIIVAVNAIWLRRLRLPDEQR